jgi:hypothetical protein
MGWPKNPRCQRSASSASCIRGAKSSPLTIPSYDPSTITFDFGILKLKALACLNLRFQEIVLFSGVISTGRSLGQVHFEMPRRVESLKQCAAWIVWNLDQFSDFKRIKHIAWVEEGRTSQSRLPWVRSMAEWKARPQCVVKRNWLRLALNTLAKTVETLPEESNVLFSFDGLVLSIQSDGEVIALAGEGVPWTVNFKVQAGALRRLPRRLMREHIGISIWKSSISIGNRTFQGTLDGFSTPDRKKIQ